MLFDDFLYDPGSGAPGARVTSFPVKVDGDTTWQLEDDVRPDTQSGRGFFRPPDGRGIMLVVQGERTELNFVAPGYDPTVFDGDEFHLGAVGQYLRPSNTAGTWNLSGQIRWSTGGHPCWGMEVLKEKTFMDVRAYDTPAIGQSARTYPEKPGITIPFDTEIALYAHIKLKRAGGGILHVAYAKAEWDATAGRYKVVGAWNDIVNNQNIAMGYLTRNGSGGFVKLFFSHYAAEYSRRASYLRRHAGASTKARLDELMNWGASAPEPPAGDTTDPVLSGLTVNYVMGESVIDFSAGATDNVGVESVQFLLDDTPLVLELNPPYERIDHPLPGGPLAPGDHVIKAIAVDTSGNDKEATVTFNVPTPPPGPTEDEAITIAREQLTDISEAAALALEALGPAPE